MYRRPISVMEVPATVPVFPLSGALLLPHTNRPLNIFEPRFLEMVNHILATDRLIGLVQPENASEEAPVGPVKLCKIGCLGRLIHFEETEEDRYVIILDGVCRFELGEELEAGTPYRQFEINASRFGIDFKADHGEREVDRERFLTIMRNYADFAGLDVDWEEVEQTGTADLVNLCSMLSPYGAAEKQVLLEAPSLSARAETLIALAEIEMARSKSGHVLQ